MSVAGKFDRSNVKVGDEITFEWVTDAGDTATGEVLAVNDFGGYPVRVFDAADPESPYLAGFDEILEVAPCPSK
jgi:hypothetical protein